MPARVMVTAVVTRQVGNRIYSVSSSTYPLENDLG